MGLQKKFKGLVYEFHPNEAGSMSYITGVTKHACLPQAGLQYG
jgi:hypothetical protein